MVHLCIYQFNSRCYRNSSAKKQCEWFQDSLSISERETAGSSDQWGRKERKKRKKAKDKKVRKPHKRAKRAKRDRGKGVAIRKQQLKNEQLKDLQHLKNEQLKELEDEGKDF